MIWELRWCRRGRSELKRLDRVIRRRVATAILRFAQTGVGDISKLRARPDEWRLRIGEWRVILRLDYREWTMTVLRVQHRSDAYR